MSQAVSFWRDSYWSSSQVQHHDVQCRNTNVPGNKLQARQPFSWRTSRMEDGGSLKHLLLGWELLVMKKKGKRDPQYPLEMKSQTINKICFTNRPHCRTLSPRLWASEEAVTEALLKSNTMKSKAGSQMSQAISFRRGSFFLETFSSGKWRCSLQHLLLGWELRVMEKKGKQDPQYLWKGKS